MRLFKKKPSSRRNPSYKNAQPESPKIFSYRARPEKLTVQQKNESEAPNRRISSSKQNAKKVYWHKMPSYLILATILVSIGYSLSLDTNPKIVAIEIKSDSSLYRTPQVYHSVAQSILGKSVLNRSKITINTSAFSSKMKQRFPELSEVAVTLPLAGRRPIVEIFAVEPKIVLQKPNTPALIIDSDGRAVMKTNEVFGLNNLGLTIVSDNSNTPAEVGKRIINREDVTFITTIIQQLKAKNLNGKSIVLPAIPNEVHVQLSDKPYYVKFNLRGDAKLQSGTFIATKKKLDSERITPAEYIDVRVEERAYYK